MEITREEAKRRFWADGSKSHNHNEIIDIVFDMYDNRVCIKCKHYEENPRHDWGFCHRVGRVEAVDNTWYCAGFK